MSERRELDRDSWEAVLRRCDCPADLESASFVCKQFLAISNDVRTSLSIPNELIPRLDYLLSRRFTCLKSINLRAFRGDASPVLLQIAQCPLPLERLDLSNQESLPFDVLGEMGSQFRDLRVLVLSDVRVFGDEDLVSIAECFPLLEELDISNPWRYRLDKVTDRGISDLSRRLQRLSRINISGNHLLSDQSLSDLSANCPSLREIRFGNCGLITGRGIASLLRETPHLASLALIKMKKGKIFCKELVDSFRHAGGLSNLDFSGSFIWDELLMSVADANIPLKSLVLADAWGFSFEGIGKIVQKHRGIKVLNLKAVGFLTDDNMRVIWKVLRSLTSINVNCCTKLTEKTLYNLMSRCPFLEEIKMMSTNLGKYKARVTRLNSSVRSLSIPCNGMTNEYLKKIGHICPKLQYLNVAGCLNITGDGISYVMRRCRELKHLKISGLKTVDLCINFKLPQLEVLRAESSTLDDEQLAAIASRCCHLRHLELQKCEHLSDEGVKRVLLDCNTLREINLKDCHKISYYPDFLRDLLFARPSLRRIVPSKPFSVPGIKEHFLRVGCRLCEE